MAEYKATLIPGILEYRLWNLIFNNGNSKLFVMVLGRCKIRENAVVSLWIYYEPPDPCTLIFRVDGYATVNSLLPSIPGIVNQSEVHNGGAGEGKVTRKDARRRC